MNIAKVSVYRCNAGQSSDLTNFVKYGVDALTISSSSVIILSLNKVQNMESLFVLLTEKLGLGKDHFDIFCSQLRSDN